VNGYQSASGCHHPLIQSLTTLRSEKQAADYARPTLNQHVKSYRKLGKESVETSRVATSTEPTRTYTINNNSNFADLIHPEEGKVRR